MSEAVKYVMDVPSARRLTERIRLNCIAVRDGVEKLQALLDEAKEGNVHVALGYPSWPAYVADVMGDEPLRLSRDDRREIVGYLTGEGMSTRAIGSVLGVSAMQVSRDREQPASGVTNVTPGSDQHVYPQNAPTAVNRSTGEVIDAEAIEDTRPAPVVAPRPVTGLDGKAYTDGRKYTRPALTPQPQPAEPATHPRRRALTDAFFDAVYDLIKKAESVHRLIEDDRFPQNAEKVAAKHRNDLLRTRDLIDQVLAQLPPEGSTI